MLRTEKSNLVSTVLDEGNGVFSVESESLPGWRYLCWPTTSKAPATCCCEDQRRKRGANPIYRCKHLKAVREFLQARRAATREIKPPSIKQNLYSMELHLRRAEAARHAAVIPRGLAFVEA